MTDEDGGTHLRSDSQASCESAEPVLRLVYRLVEDLQRVRLAHGNRIRQVLPLIPETVQPPRGVPSWAVFFKESAEVLEAEEARVVKLAERLLKADPVGEWLLSQKGMGPKLGVSILGEVWPIGCRVHGKGESQTTIESGSRAQVSTDGQQPSEPACRFASPRRLWAYAGLHVGADGKAVKRAKGQKANWNARLKTRCYLFAVSALKAGGPWRDVYDQRKAIEFLRAGLQEPFDSQRAGEAGARDGQPTVDSHRLDDLPRGGQADDDSHFCVDPVRHPEAGDAQQRRDSQARPELSRLHCHNRALRLVSKTLLKQLWRVAHGLPAE